MIGRELLRIAAEHIARELVEQDDRRQRRQRIVEEGAHRQLALLRPKLLEALADLFIDRGIPAPPAAPGRGRTSK